MKVVNQNYNFNQKQFGLKLKQLREEKGYTQQEIADKLGLVSGNSISAYENGTVFPREKNLYTLSRIYATSLDYLLGRDERKEETFKNEVVELVYKKEKPIDCEGLYDDQIKLVTNIVNQFKSTREKSDTDTIGERLRRLRISNDATIKEISEMTGISYSTIQIIETGKGKPNLESLATFAKLYGVTTDYILGLEKEKTSADTTGLTFHQKRLVSKLIESFRETNRGGGGIPE